MCGADKWCGLDAYKCALSFATDLPHLPNLADWVRHCNQCKRVIITCCVPPSWSQPPCPIKERRTAVSTPPPKNYPARAAIIYPSIERMDAALSTDWSIGARMVPCFITRYLLAHESSYLSSIISINIKKYTNLRRYELQNNDNIIITAYLWGKSHKYISINTHYTTCVYADVWKGEVWLN